MPRLPVSLFWRARAIAPDVARLLPVCRDLASAVREYRWIRQESRHKSRRAVAAMCRRRGRGEPLQYVLGTQPFGTLDLLCRPGVLIPRPEPEAYTLHLARLLAASSTTIVDACTGSGCIALLLYERLRAARPDAAVHVVGVDVAREAVRLARANAKRNGLASDASRAQYLSFVLGDVLDDAWLDTPAMTQLRATATTATTATGKGIDLLVANPPYISTAGFARDTARSVRLFEPRGAQVPQVEGADADADVFHHRLLALAQALGARRTLVEVGDADQALRVARLAQKTHVVEIWADDPGGPTRRTVESILVRGDGPMRSVYVRQK